MRTRTRLAAPLTPAQIMAAEDAWRPATRPDLPETVPGAALRWGAEPYPLPPFLELLDVAIAHLGLPRPVFCDVGAGPGGKVILAAQRGCRAWGVDIVPGYVAAAQALGADVRLGTAQDTDLTGTGIVWCAGLYRAAAHQQATETQIAAAMRPGAVLILANTPAPPAGWAELAWDPAARLGTWVKP
jgi:hypothetical protein